MTQEDRDKYNLKQLNVEIPQETLTGIKIVAAMRNIPVRTWVLRAIVNALREESKG